MSTRMNIHVMDHFTSHGNTQSHGTIYSGNIFIRFDSLVSYMYAIYMDAGTCSGSPSEARSHIGLRGDGIDVRQFTDFPLLRISMFKDLHLAPFHYITVQARSTLAPVVMSRVMERGIQGIYMVHYVILSYAWHVGV